MRFVWRLAVNAVALWLAAELLPGVIFDGGFVELILVALIFGLVNALVRPIVKLLTIPIRIVTVGLFTFVINALMVMITAGLTDLDLEGGIVKQFLVPLMASLVISVVSVVLSWILPDGR